MPEESKRACHRETSRWQAAIDRLGAVWCASMPVSPRMAARSPRSRHARVRSLQSTMPPLWIVLLIQLAIPVRLGGGPVSQSAALAALARYVASPEPASPWSLETVEIDASLPKLEKSGRLRAIRRLLPFAKPQYQVLELAGDRTVRQQVIVRYLSAEMEAAAIPASSTAITPANYNFRYKGYAGIGDAPAYVFLLSPKKKGQGLIKGELWLDGATGAVLRVSGRLVKNPSIFIKRVDVIRNTAVRDGIAEMQVTHLSVDVRFIGRAELTVQERPCAAADCGSASAAGGQ